MQNKINHGFNTTDIIKEFCLLYDEVGEASEVYRKKQKNYGRLADVAIYLLKISKLLGFVLEKEIKDKMEVNKKRIYKSEWD